MLDIQVKLADCAGLVIRNESDLQDAQLRLRVERRRASEYRSQLEASQLPPDDVERALQSVMAFIVRIEQDVRLYERTRRGDVATLGDLEGFGRALVSLRVAAGLTQRELAARLGVHESLVSRDERNEYQGLTIQRASLILRALRVQISCAFQLDNVEGSVEKEH